MSEVTGDTREKNPLMVPRGWMQAAAIVLIFGFFILGVLTYYTYNDEPPIPKVVKSANGSTLFTREDIMAGQQIFLRNGMMEYGSIFGHGAYLGPDFTAEYLHRAALSSIDFYGGANSDTARSRTIRDFKTNRYDNATGALVYTDAKDMLLTSAGHYALFFGSDHEIRPAAERHSGYGRGPRANRFLQLVGLVGLHSSARPLVLLYEQLATGAAGGQSCDGGLHRVERAFAGCLARGNRFAACRVWPVESAGMARARATEHIVPRSG